MRLRNEDGVMVVYDICKYELYYGPWGELG